MKRAGRIHYGWIVLGVLVVLLIAGNGLRSVFGVFIKPLEAEFGWSRTSLSVAAAISLFLLGAIAPFAGRMTDLFGGRRVFSVSLVLLGIGTFASSFVTQLWHVYAASGIAMALGAGGATLTTAIPVLARWFDKRRGLVIGVAGAAMSAAQLVVVPLAMWLMLWLGWRSSYFWLAIGLFLLILPLSIVLLRSEPKDKGLEPYGANPLSSAGDGGSPRAEPRVSIGEAAQVRAFWLLSGTYFVCGYTSGGLVGTHLIPFALERGFPEMVAAQALGVMGAMSIFGTIASGWICDRFGRKGPLAWYYFVRGLSLLFLLVVWDAPSLYLFAAILGLNWFSTVPPTTTLTANIFGRPSVGELTGWIFVSHQVGAALAATLGGWIHDLTGNYSWAFISAAVLGFIASGLALAVREEPVTVQPSQAPGIPAASRT